MSCNFRVSASVSSLKNFVSAVLKNNNDVLSQDAFWVRKIVILLYTYRMIAKKQTLLQSM
jgi:hypothetical protein